MMGPRQEAQPALFYEFSLEDHVPQDHLLRSIDRFVDLGGIRRHLAEFYSHTGRPTVDPDLLIRMLLVGYCFGIRSERRLCEEVHLNLAYRWFCRLDLGDRVPDHSTFSKNRHGRFRDSELLRHLFEMTVARCIEEGLVSGQRMAIDASLIEADANKQNSTSKEDWDVSQIDPADAPRAVREYLDTLDEAAFGAGKPVPLVTLLCNALPVTDGSAQGTGILQLFRQLPDRHGSRRDRRCRGDKINPASRTRLDQDHAGSGEDQVRPASRTPDRRHRVWHRLDAGLAGRPQDRPAHPGPRQVWPQRWHLEPGGLRVGRRERPIRLP